MDDFEIEELKEGESPVRHLIAGALAGTAEHCGLFPFDTIKTNMQAEAPTSNTYNRGSIQTASNFVKRYGFLGLYRGVGTMAAGAAPAHALHFTTYEFCKRQFGGTTSSDGHHPFKTAGAGMCATIVSDGVLTPMDAIKQRLQLGVRQYRGGLDCFRTVLKHEGFFALYASYTTTLLMNVPYNAIYFATYESLRRLLKRGSEREFDLGAHFLAGGLSGSCAAALTNPMDVAKTRLQTQGDVIGPSRKYNGMVNTILTIAKEEGVRGFTKGIAPRITLHSCSAAICWITYEYVKYFLDKVGIG